jgi:5-methylcytosine-specific restriction endonuclease McrA
VLDRQIRRWCSELSERDLALGMVAESARRAEIWRRLGFASEAQYARERLGVSLTSLKTKRILAARAGRVPELASALARGRVGYEAAYLLSRVATPGTVNEWIRRAEQRTVKHLREEVDAAELLIRVGRGRDQRPLDAPCLEALFELERCIVSGDTPKEPTRGPRENGCAGSATPEGSAGGQMSGNISALEGLKHFGRVAMRWCVSVATRSLYRALEREFVRLRTRVCRKPVSFLRFLCENFCRIWLPVLRRERLTESGEKPEYFGVYRRDGFRCASPVCTRRDVTPHHLVFRSRGGGDEEENVASLCVWCHLHGVHEGRIAAEPPATRIRWRIGRRGTLYVEGRIAQRG